LYRGRAEDSNWILTKNILKKHIGVYKEICQKEEEKEIQRQNL